MRFRKPREKIDASDFGFVSSDSEEKDDDVDGESEDEVKA